MTEERENSIMDSPPFKGIREKLASFSRSFSSEPEENEENSDNVSSLKEKMSSFGKSVKETMSDAVDTVAHAVDEHLAVLDQFVTGAVVVLISRSSGHAMQIVDTSGKKPGWMKRKMSASGVSNYGGFAVDGNGGEGEDEDLSHWSVIDLGGRCVRLHIKNNFLAIVAGRTTIVHCEDHAKVGDETKLNLDHDEQFVQLESDVTPGHHVGILADGSLKMALATGTEQDSCFAVMLISSPEPVENGEANGSNNKE